MVDHSSKQGPRNYADPSFPGKDATDAARGLVQVLGDIARGKYSNAVYTYTSDQQPETVRRIAEAMGMMVKVEAREHRMQMYNEELQQANDQLHQVYCKPVVAV